MMIMSNIDRMMKMIIKNVRIAFVQVDGVSHENGKHIAPWK